MIFQGVKLYNINKPMLGEAGMVECYLVRDILELIKTTTTKKRTLHLCPVISFQQDPVDVYTI